ncbi:tripartite motif-containing protein 44 [Denticeps clupeoides]|uniref:B box-type domain-containing protein n=1 Tax=Denticeps clupeoides TaxID=299321 RepID=A0AAY4B4V7_9TELE|nr:tripartite motif-containing protein 44 [Denticeps clupeoides]
MTDRGACWEGPGDIAGDLPQTDGFCDVCDPDEAQPASQVCPTCSFAFCDIHAKKHILHALTPYAPHDPSAGNQQPEAEGAENHRPRNVGEGAEANGAGGPEGEPEEAGAGRRDTVTVERLRCKEHGQEGSLYCKPDEKIVCVVCAVQGEHRGHEIITLREAYLWQKSKQGIDLLGCTQDMAEKIKTKWTSPDMSPEQLELYVNQQFDELHRLVQLEEKRTLHLVDLKEAFLTAQAAEKIAEITVHTERLQEEMACITQQLGELDQVEQDGVPPIHMLQQPAAMVVQPAVDAEVRPRPPEPRHDPEDPRGYEGEGRDSFMGNAP